MTQDLLKSIIDTLDFNQGQLYDVSTNIRVLGGTNSLNLRDWLTTARKAGAEKIFFVDNNPVVVFARCEPGHLAKNIAFNKLWCLSRPRILFLECDGELSVIDLAQAPIRPNISKNQPELITLETLRSIKDAAQQIQDFHRDNIESGKIFESGRFGDIKNRADKALISDLKEVRQALLATELTSSYAHALIGRSIFIRYLEDRGILTEAYFTKIAEGTPEWETLLNKSYSRENLDFSGVRALYPRVLRSKSFTYELYRSLSADFNGDMFPNIDEEEQHVQNKHLELILDLLYGDSGVQKKLFFFSYKFDIVPLDLISAIYENFYHASPTSPSKDKKSNKGTNQTRARQDGAYYTPPVLAEFVLSRLLTVDVLEKSPRVLDPACGSGIFLVEAFRRIIRYHISKHFSVPSFNDLKQILSKQIAGIEINEEAARITAFSLYLAMLHYLDSPSILDHIKQGNKLPNLIVSKKNSTNHYNNIHIGNAFSIDAETVGDVDVIVGNPPWGAPGRGAKKDVVARHSILLQWCKDRNLPIGDKEPSQAFLWRAMDFLKPNGKCSMLTSSGVLFKHNSTSMDFRREWMKQVCITEVFNFSHVRKFFFQNANAPFVLIHFQKSSQNEPPIEYWSLKQVAAQEKTQAVFLSKYDRAYLVKQDLTDHKTWKVHWFGRHADAVFISQLCKMKKLVDLVDREKSGQGYKKTSPAEKDSKISLLSSLVNNSFSRYSELMFESAPEKFNRLGIPSVYYGHRLLIKRGISERGEIKGNVISRLETTNFCFTSAINGLKLKNDSEKNYLLILGVLWSSFSRYFYFNISANWGGWHFEIHLNDEILQLPIPDNSSLKITEKVVSIVQKLRNSSPKVRDLQNIDGVQQNEIEANRQKLEMELDEAVFNLYDLNEEQRDLIRDCCEVTLPFLYKPYDSTGVMPAVEEGDVSWMLNYAERFARHWQPYLDKDEVLRADLHTGALDNMVAMEFYPADTGDKWALNPRNDSWSYILEELGKALPRPMGTTQILLDGIVHVVTDNSIIVIKRNEKRLWTRSLAREDAESTLVKRMIETMPSDGGCV